MSDVEFELPISSKPFTGLGRIIDDKFVPITLRDYQLGAVASVRRFFAEGYRKLLGVMSMGGGKTVCFAELARRFAGEGKRSLILVDQDELVWQAVKRVTDVTGGAIVPDVEKAEHTANLRAPVVVATVQSMNRRLSRYPRDHFGFVVADECDKSLTPMWQSTLNHFDAHALVLGVTATPLRADRKSITTYYEAKAFGIGMFDLIRMGHLSRIVVRTVPLEIDVRNVKQNQGDYDVNELGETLRAYYREIRDAIKNYASDRRVLMFWPLIRTSEEFVKVATLEGITARHIDGKSPDRMSLQRAYRNGAFQVLSNAQLLGRGWDETSVDCVINCRVTRHGSTYRQLIGRGIRPHPGKRDCLILDFLWQWERFGVMRAADLIAKNRKQAEKISAKIDAADAILDLEAVDQAVSMEHEEALVEEFQRRRRRHGTVFDALEWAAALDIRDLIEYEPETKRDLKPMTSTQARRLERAGFLLESVSGFGHAKRIVELLDERIKKRLCTFKQLHWLMRYGYTRTAALEIGFDEAKGLLDKLFGK